MICNQIRLLNFLRFNFFGDLRIHLARVGNISRQKENTESSSEGGVVTSLEGNFQVWMTLVTHDALSSSLTHYLSKISWDSFMRRAVEVTDVINKS